MADNDVGYEADKTTGTLSKHYKVIPQAVQRLYRTGKHSKEELAKVFGVNRSTIERYTKGVGREIGRFGRPRKVTPEQAKDICRLYRTGEYPIADLAERFGFAESTIHAVLMREETDESHE
jgi:DNA invertase Pin-like site-specific DNA recombinase